MRIRLVCIGTRPPSWVREGYRDYARRLPRSCALELAEVPPARSARLRNSRSARNDECQRLLAAVPDGDYRVALDETGEQWTTSELSRVLENWMGQGRNVSLMIGGADGLSNECIDAADTRWSLSRLTFPHAMVRVVVAEQIYRAWTILQHHPYHRA
ncbi:MAG: 23S rRNA (pseudouridine(1915)-N(3))-methyltransferase RlmH [Gammaproteobacteria bacterium]|nr:23S rRNA (pseudouridine(1915)-N(3))-methyltransferase RlmH [Gammaproteobacteria bacterium]